MRENVEFFAPPGVRGAEFPEAESYRGGDGGKANTRSRLNIREDAGGDGGEKYLVPRLGPRGTILGFWNRVCFFGFCLIGTRAGWSTGLMLGLGTRAGWSTGTEQVLVNVLVSICPCPRQRVRYIILVVCP